MSKNSSIQKYGGIEILYLSSASRSDARCPHCMSVFIRNLASWLFTMHGAVLDPAVGRLHDITYNHCKQKEGKKMDSAVFFQPIKNSHSTLTFFLTSHLVENAARQHYNRLVWWPVWHTHYKCSNSKGKGEIPCQQWLQGPSGLGFDSDFLCERSLGAVSRGAFVLVTDGF